MEVLKSAILLLLCCILTGCAEEGCINTEQTSFVTLTYNESVKANPQDNANFDTNNEKTYWKQSTIPASDKLVTLTIRFSEDINFCDETGETVPLSFSEAKDVGDNKDNPVLPWLIHSTDSINITLAPTFINSKSCNIETIESCELSGNLNSSQCQSLKNNCTITPDLCGNNDSRVYIKDQSKCRSFQDYRINLAYFYIDPNNTSTPNFLYNEAKKDNLLLSDILYNAVIEINDPKGLLSDIFPDWQQGNVDAVCTYLKSGAANSNKRINYKLLNEICGNLATGYNFNNVDSPPAAVSLFCSASLADISKNECYIPGVKGKLCNLGGIVCGDYPNEIGKDGLPAGIKTVVEKSPQDPSQISTLHLFLDPSSDYNKGGYNLRLKRNCRKRAALSLCIATAEDAPNVSPNESGCIGLEQKDKDLEVYTTRINVPENSRIYYGIKDVTNNKFFGGEGYVKNKGQYNITAEVTEKNKDPTLFSIVVRKISCTIMKSLYDASKYNCTGLSSSNPAIVTNLYNKFIGDSTYINIIRLLISLAFSIYGFLFIMGMVRSVKSDFLITFIKTSIVLVLISPSSWDFFYNQFFSFFIELSAFVIDGIFSSSSGQSGTSSFIPDFGFIDETLDRFFKKETWLQLLSLLLNFPLGWLYLYLILWAFWEFALAILHATISFFLSIFIVGILISAAPIFITFILFKRTQKIFDDWVKLLTEYSLHPAFSFVTLGMFNAIIAISFYNVFGFQICKACIFTLKLSLFLPFLPDPCLIYGYLPPPVDNQAAAADASLNLLNLVGFAAPNISIIAVITLVLIAHAMKFFTRFSSEILNAMIGSFATGNLLVGSTEEMQKGLGAWVGINPETRLDEMKKQKYRKANIRPPARRERGGKNIDKDDKDDQNTQKARKNINSEVTSDNDTASSDSAPPDSNNSNIPDNSDKDDQNTQQARENINNGATASSDSTSSDSNNNVPANRDIEDNQ